MKSLLRAASIVVLLTASVFGDYLRIDPPAPDSGDLIVAEMGGVWRDLCVPGNPVVVRNGDFIAVNLDLPGAVCPPATAPWDERVPLGSLEPGFYTLRVFIHDPRTLGPPSQFASLQFPVTDAEAQHTISPNVGPATGGTEVTILGTLGTCPFAPPCIDPQVLFGGVPATSVRQIEGGVIAVTPPHAPGVVDVEIKGLAGATVAVLAAGFTYQGPGAPDPVAYTPVLVPLIFSGPGAFGSQFITEATFRNESDVVITPLNAGAISTCPPNVSPCPAPPFAARAWDSFHHGAEYPTGLVLWIPRSQEPDMHFSLHVRDISRAAEGAGTNIPVVREDELQGEVHLLNIPVASGFRHTLRIYDLDFENAGAVTLEAFSSSGDLIDARVITLTRAEDPCAIPEGCAPNRPRAAIVNDLVTPREVPQAVRFVIRPTDPGMRLWAFVSITNNTTQQITTVTPE